MRRKVNARVVEDIGTLVSLLQTNEASSYVSSSGFAKLTTIKITEQMAKSSNAKCKKFIPTYQPRNPVYSPPATSMDNRPTPKMAPEMRAHLAPAELIFLKKIPSKNAAAIGGEI